MSIFLGYFLVFNTEKISLYAKKYIFSLLKSKKEGKKQE
jgi:hypothetical protein